MAMLCSCVSVCGRESVCVCVSVSEREGVCASESKRESFPL